MTKFATYENAGQRGVGVLDETARQVHPIALDGVPVRDLLTVIRAELAGVAWTRIGESVSMDAVHLLAPLPHPARNIFCVGKNYRSHAEEFSRSGFDAGQEASASAIPEVPIIFTKAPSTVIAHGDAIWAAEEVTDALDYEAELAVIIGRPGRGIVRSDAMQHVWGYTVFNDVTARDWQRRHKQWFLGKSFDTFGPMGPVAVTADSVDGANLDLRCWVNGELRQTANTRDLIFDIPSIIETLSAGITLELGDVIATGTPDGVGIGYQPPRFLIKGDVVTVEIDGIGRLENRVA